jgi:hypothetical protein
LLSKTKSYELLDLFFGDCPVHISFEYFLQARCCCPLKFEDPVIDISH